MTRIYKILALVFKIGLISVLVSFFSLSMMSCDPSMDVVPKKPVPGPAVVSSNNNTTGVPGNYGALSFNLQWSSANSSLSLYVSPPFGNTIYYYNQFSNGGQMDVSCNCCSSNSLSYYNGYFYENIYYPSSPSNGTYSYWVRNNGSCNGSSSFSSTSYLLRVYKNGSLVKSSSGSVSTNNTSSTFTYYY